MRHERPEESEVFESVKNGLVTSVEGTGDVARAIVETTAHTIEGAGKAGAEGVHAIIEVARGVVHGVTELNGDLGVAAEGTVFGIMLGTQRVHAMETIGHTSWSVIRSTAEVGGDLGMAAKGLVQGAIRGARDVGVSVEEAAAAAASGALDAAGKVGLIAAEKVRNAVSETISGVKIVLDEPIHDQQQRSL